MAAEHPDVVRRLDAHISHYLTDAEAVAPLPNPRFDPERYDRRLEGVAALKGKPNNMTHDGKSQQAIVRFESQHAIVALRLDPGQAAGTVTLNALRLENAQGEIVYDLAKSSSPK